MLLKIGKIMKINVLIGGNIIPLNNILKNNDIFLLTLIVYNVYSR